MQRLPIITKKGLFLQITPSVFHKDKRTNHKMLFGGVEIDSFQSFDLDGELEGWVLIWPDPEGDAFVLSKSTFGSFVKKFCQDRRLVKEDQNSTPSTMFKGVMSLDKALERARL